MADDLGELAPAEATPSLDNLKPLESTERKPAHVSCVSIGPELGTGIGAAELVGVAQL